ncbi:hypothetical protein E2C01_077724 [Portunus trituberculatus]|uniref:Uncharacterized protein n=1 Tax=Portunus trituberculatus TaxID=210409 RepID=A0A5B7IS83_PORTR|nr:hypothetical protein [Portunus trituberculatus]
MKGRRLPRAGVTLPPSFLSISPSSSGDPFILAFQVSHLLPLVPVTHSSPAPYQPDPFQCECCPRRLFITSTKQSFTSVASAVSASRTHHTDQTFLQQNSAGLNCRNCKETPPAHEEMFCAPPFCCCVPLSPSVSSLPPPRRHPLRLCLLHPAVDKGDVCFVLSGGTAPSGKLRVVVLSLLRS